MASRLLTVKFVASVKPTPGRRVEYFDTEVPGLALRVMPSGTKSWTVLYRHRARLRRLTLGSVAKISLGQARDRARDELHAASKGADPATIKQTDRTARTFAELAETYLEKHAKVNKRSWRADDNLLRRKILPVWRHRAIVDLKRHDVLALVGRVAEAGAPVVAN